MAGPVSRFGRGDVIVIPFPFSDLSQSKRPRSSLRRLDPMTSSCARSRAELFAMDSKWELRNQTSDKGRSNNPVMSVRTACSLRTVESSSTKPVP
jgi:hypothetical protein